MSTVSPEVAKLRSIAFLNLAHAIDHFVLLIFPTIVIGLEVVFDRPYAEMIKLTTAAFVAFGLFSLPAGWLADRWSRRSMMAAFFVGCGASLIAAAFAPSLTVLAVARLPIRISAIPCPTRSSISLGSAIWAVLKVSPPASEMTT